MSLPLRTARHKRRALKQAGTFAVDDITVIRSKVRITDHDAFGHMTNSRYNSFLQIAREDWLIKTGIGPLLTRDGINLCIRSESGQFLKALRAPTPFKVSTQLVETGAEQFVFSGHFIRRELICATFKTDVFLQNQAGETVDPAPYLSQRMKHNSER